MQPAAPRGLGRRRPEEAPVRPQDLDAAVTKVTQTIYRTARALGFSALLVVALAAVAAAPPTTSTMHVPHIGAPRSSTGRRAAVDVDAVFTKRVLKFAPASTTISRRCRGRRR